MPPAVRIALLRPLARRHPHRYGPRLAEALVTRSQQVKVSARSVPGRTAAAAEAVTLRRRLEAEQPGSHRVGLARALVAQAAVPDDRTVAAALAQCEEAIGYVEDATDRAALLVLAEARRLAATYLYQSGEVRDALRLAQRARSTWDRLVPRTVAERMRSALTLSVIGDCQAALQRHEEALAAREEAMALYRRTPLLRQARWLPAGLPIAIGLVESLAAVGRLDEAVDLAAETRTELRFLARVRLRPELVRPRLGRVSTTLARCRLALDDPAEARRAAEEAVDHWRSALADGSSQDRGGLGDALLVLAEVTRGTGRGDEAAEQLAEAVDVVRGADDDLLARALTELVVVRVAEGDGPAVQELLAELVDLCRRHHERLPEVWRPRLAVALSLTCAMPGFDWPSAPAAGATPPRVPPATEGTVPAETLQAAQAAGREAVELGRLLAGADPRYRNLLSGCLFGLARMVHLGGDPRGSAELLDECVAIRRELFAEDPAKHRLSLTEALSDLGNRRHAVDRSDEALDAYRECVDLLRADPQQVDQATLLTPLRNLMRVLWRLDRKAEANHVWDEIRAVEESVGTAGPDPA
ncbi:hypothetical protein [Micromonospora purpureochromogenes]|uniref:Tetratricopeptide (TPR) repeat protein n=1 Tax=Micromonospora purpureochromogenes TaxID=47872 RepID=A0ABX2RQA3_9ACTN|nr:hypothetical protein [Micromonospora purpureochromogenes]NYF57399.1 tetratricopeptide (TPR) repeat protein [Micromonospora purpureochromogenes]